MTEQYLYNATLNKLFDITPLNLHTAAVYVPVRHFLSSAYTTPEPTSRKFIFLSFSVISVFRDPNVSHINLLYEVKGSLQQTNFVCPWRD